MSERFSNSALGNMLAREHLSPWALGMAAITLIALVGVFAYFATQLAAKKPAAETAHQPLAQGTGFQPGIPRAAIDNAQDLASASAARDDRNNGRNGDPQNLFALRPELPKGENTVPALAPAPARMQTTSAVDPRPPENTAAAPARISYAAACDGAADKAACEAAFCARPENADRPRCKRPSANKRPVAPPEERIMN